MLKGEAVLDIFLGWNLIHMGFILLKLDIAAGLLLNHPIELSNGDAGAMLENYLCTPVQTSAKTQFRKKTIYSESMNRKKTVKFQTFKNLF